jgi:hypothetical protein
MLMPFANKEAYDSSSKDYKSGTHIVELKNPI